MIAEKDSVLSARDLSVGYRTRGGLRIVLKGLDISVRRGELVCLLGPNGIGKSTLLRTLARILPPISGSITIEGKELRHLPQIELAKRLGVVLTDRVEGGALQAYKVVELGRYPHLGWSGRMADHDHAVVRWAIAATGAEHLARRQINRLSDGERQRLMVARALAQEPAVLLLDEPTAFLDVPSRVELMGLLRQLAREENLAVVFSTHDLELALRTADTVWLISPEGRFDVGAPEDIVLAGLFAIAFPSENIRFQPEERAFRLLTEPRGRAAILGTGLPSILAAAVLEREGYQVTGDESALLVVTIDQDSRWQAVCGPQRRAGDNFAELARFCRQAPLP